MALDGVFLRHLKKEIGAALIGSRVDKVFQPNRDELILAFRGFDAAHKLLISARANSARINLTKIPVENPQQPPMLCMLLRKKLQCAKLLDITQPELERALMLKFDSVNELGDHVELTLAVEIMGRYSNIILVDENGKIPPHLRELRHLLELHLDPGNKFEQRLPADLSREYRLAHVELAGQCRRNGTDHRKRLMRTRQTVGYTLGKDV